MAPPGLVDGNLLDQRNAGVAQYGDRLGRGCESRPPAITSPPICASSAGEYDSNPIRRAKRDASPSLAARRSISPS